MGTRTRVRKPRASAWGIPVAIVALLLLGLLTVIPSAWPSGPAMAHSSRPAAPVSPAAGRPLVPAGTTSGVEIPIIPPPSSTPEVCANGSPANPFPVSFLPYGYITPNLYGLGNGSAGFDNLCYAGGPAGAVENDVNFTNVGGASGVLAYPHVEYGQDLWGGSPGNMSPDFVLPTTVSNMTNTSLWLTNTYSVHDDGAAAYDYVWDNFLSSYVPTPANLTGPTNYSMEIMLWMTTGYESPPYTYFVDGGSTQLPTLVNTTLSSEPWDFSYFCQGADDSELTVLYFYNGTGGAMNTTSRTFGVDFSAVLENVNTMIHADGISCWSYPENNDAHLYLDDLNLGSEFLTPWPSPYYGEAQFNWTISSMCFVFPIGTVSAASVSCLGNASAPLSATATLSPPNGIVPLAVNFSATAMGGTSPYEFNWSFGDGSFAAGPDATHVYTVAGSYAVTVAIEDSAGGSVEQHLTVVASAPGTLWARVSASPTQGVAPLLVEFNSSITGGIAPYTLAWMSGGSRFGTASTAERIFPSPGVYEVTLWVNDSTVPSAQTDRANVTVIVSGSAGGASASPNGGLAGVFGSDVYAWAVAISAAAAVAIIVIVLARRRRPPPPSDLSRASTFGP